VLPTVRFVRLKADRLRGTGLKLINIFKDNSYSPYILDYVKYSTMRRVGSVFVCGMTPRACPRGRALLFLSE